MSPDSLRIKNTVSIPRDKIENRSTKPQLDKQLKGD
jgi:hypothetical protein